MNEPLTPVQRANMAHDERIKDVTRTARDYQNQYPNITWSEAIRLAEKHVPQVKV
jgi:hypothetical protein